MQWRISGEITSIICNISEVSAYNNYKPIPKTMEDLTLEQITALQKKFGVTEAQNDINTGYSWHTEGAVGRFADSCLEWGICMLPEVRHKDAYGNTVPSRNDLAPDTKGSFGNCLAFWTRINDGDYEAVDAVESMFGVDNYEQEN